MFVRLTNNMTYLTGNEGQKFLTVFSVARLERFHHCTAHASSCHFIASQYANEHGLPRPDSAHFEHGGGSTRNTKGEYVVLVCHKHYLPTYLARVFTVFEAGSVSVPHASFSCTRMYLPTNVRMRNATYSPVKLQEDECIYKPTAPRVRTLVPFIETVFGVRESPIIV